MGNRLRGATTQQVAVPVQGAIVPEQINSGILFDPTADGWDIVQRTFDCNVWRNMKTGQQVQEYRLVANDEFQFMDYQKSFKLRFRNATLVSSLFFKDQTQSEFCTKYYKGNLFLERTPLRLSDIDQIPYPDVLHIYYQCFKGYAELFQAMGFFDISEQMICINAQGVVKVWLNKNLDKYLPPVCYHNGNQRQMVLKVVRIISQNTNQNTLPDRISDWIIRADPYTFRDAFSSLQGFASKYNTTIPGELSCVINFMRLKYVQQQQIYEGAPMDFDLNPEQPQVDIARLNQMISQNFTPIFDQPPPCQYQYNPPQQAKIPPVTTTVVSQQLYRQPQVHKRRRILQHKDHPVLYSNFIRDSTSGRIPMSSVVINPTSNSYAQNRITFGHQPIVQSSNVYSSQNPFKSVLQKLKISNHYQPKVVTTPVSQTVYVPQRDIVTSNSYQSNNNYSSNAFKKQKINYAYESGMVTSGGGVVTNSLASHKYPTYGNYGVSDSIQQGKTSPQILAFIQKFKNSQDISPIQFETSSNIYKKQSDYKYETTPPPIVSQTSSGAVYKDIGNTSHLIDHNKFADSFSIVQNRLQIIQQTLISTVRRQQSTRPRLQLSNIDQEIQKDLKKFRSSKASKASKTSFD